VDGVMEYESPAHAPRFPYRLGIHGTVWRFRLISIHYPHFFVTSQLKYTSFPRFFSVISTTVVKVDKYRCGIFLIFKTSSLLIVVAIFILLVDIIFHVVSSVLMADDVRTSSMVL
jgi:hypothetical protein